MEFFETIGLVAGATGVVAEFGGFFLLVAFVGGLTGAIIKAAKEF